MASDYKKTSLKENKPDTLCLDFANTVAWHASEFPEESLHSFEDLLAWAEQHGIVDEAASGRLGEVAREKESEASAVLADGIRLREAIFRTFSSHASGRFPPEGDLDILNEFLTRSVIHLQLRRTGQEYSLQWCGEDGTFDRLLWPVAHSAVDLLLSPWLDRVGECADENGCGWLFLDESRNHNRRWCNMSDCGNRAKARRFYRRSQQDLSSPA